MGTLRQTIVAFDYNRPASLFMESPTGRGRPLGYRAFRSAAEAIRFAVEELPANPGLRTCMKVGDERFDSDAIPQLYESAEYPLPRTNSITALGSLTFRNT